MTTNADQQRKNASILSANILSDRRTVRGIGVLVAAILVLMALIVVLTFIPATTITSTAQTQSSERQSLLAQSLARRLEGFFNTLANDLIDLAGRPAVQSMTGLRRDALRILAELGARRSGEITAIVRLARDGSPRYAWPERYQERIEAGQPLPWSVDAAWVDSVVRSRGVQFTRRSTGDGVAYVLVTPVAVGLGISEALAFEIDINAYFDRIFSPLDLGKTGQLWVLSAGGSQVYTFRPQPEFSGGTAQLLALTSATLLPGYPTPDRESIAVPVYTAFTQDRNAIGSMVLIFSRTLSEAAEVVQGTLQSLFFFSLGVIAFVALFGVLIGLYLLRESRRRRRAEMRRATANTLLDISRALNSSLKLDEVLRRILDNLGTVLPHDGASVMLLDENDSKFVIVAETGSTERRTYAVGDVTGAKEVARTHKPVVIPNCLNDPRWSHLPGSRIRAWLGVPLRVRDEMVGVLSVNSFTENRYTPDDIAVAAAFADQAGVAIQNARMHELEIKVYETELETARAIQTSLLPQEPPPLPQVQLAARSIPARQVSGDFHQYFALPDGKLGVAVGDVSGKGIPAALLMAVIMTALRDEIIHNAAPADLLVELNSRLLSRMRQNNMNTGLLVSVYDPRSHWAEIAAGGMLSPYMRDGHNGRQWHEVQIGGYPLGASAATSYRAEQVRLSPGALLVFVTDGVIEARDRQGQLFSFERFEALLNSIPGTASADQVADFILSGVRAHLDGQEPQDDLTIVVLKSLEG